MYAGVKLHLFHQITMTKKQLAITILSIVVVACLVLAGCQHTHNFSSSWLHDEVNHWRACDGCDEVSDKSQHSFGEWKVDVDPTETTTGSQHRTCSVCSYVENDTIPVLSEKHDHVFGTEWLSDGVYHWHECSCEEMSAKAEHTLSDWIVDTPATTQSKGSQHKECTVCGRVLDTQDIDKLPEQHQHSFVGGYSSDDNYHWLTCACGETSDKVAHTPSNWIVDIPATTHAKGSQHKECTVCGRVLDTQDIDKLPEQHQHSFVGGYSSDDNYHWQTCSCGEPSEKQIHTPSNWIVDKQATYSHEGLQHQECTVCEKVLQTATIPKLERPEQATGTVDMYAINDFHGEYAKLAQIAGYISARGNETNTVTLNSGDMFQGSMQSNSNYGKLFAECMDIAGFDAFTFGNHEFDWGLDNLKELASNSNVPYLGANIYNWNAKSRTWGDFAEDLAQEYVIKDLDNGIRVGIIGIIGKDQITSISSQLVQTIGFKDPKDIVPNLSNKLRNNFGCDIIVVSAHTGQETFLDDSSWDITQYVDAVFCAHSHSRETYIKNGVPFVQGGSYGSYVSHIRLTLDDNGNVNCNTYENIAYNSLNGISQSIKAQVQSKIDNSNAQIASEANEVLATISGGYLNSSTAVPRMVAHAIALYATAQGYDIELAMVNNARNSLSQGNITYSDLFEAIPFDNVVYIARVSGADLINEAGYSSNSIWRVNGTAIENSNNKYYTIAVIDYLLYHQNSNRNYNYFPSAFTSGFDPVRLTKEGVDQYNYRYLTRDFLRDQGTIDAYTYLDNSNVHTNSSWLTRSVNISSFSQTQIAPDGAWYNTYSELTTLTASSFTNQDMLLACDKNHAINVENFTIANACYTDELCLQSSSDLRSKVYIS